MDAKRFDSITRIVAVAPSRRKILGLALAGATGLLRWADTTSKRKRKKKKCGNCGACKRCVKGACKPKPNGTPCGDGDSCQGGVCGCEPGFEPCGGACVQSCAAGQDRGANCQCTCTTQGCAGCCDGETCLPVGASQSPQKCGSGGAACEACSANETCAQGACACLSGFEPCGGNCVESCSGDKILVGSCQCACPGDKHDCGGNVCEPCCDDDDCDRDRTCQDNTCLCPPNREECGDVCCAATKICADAETSLCVTGRGTCQEGADTCPIIVGNPLINCNARLDCFCFQTMGDDTRCGQFIPPASFCGECENDDDCESTYGPGTFCVAGSQPSCCVNGGNICAAPCSTDPPEP